MSRPSPAAVVVSIIYFAALAGDWWPIFYLLAFAGSIPAFIYLFINFSGRRPLWSFLLMFIPVVGAVLALGRFLKNSGPQIALGIALWSAPAITYESRGLERLVIFAILAVLLWATLSFVPPFRLNPSLTSIAVIALPTILFVLIVSIFAPFISSSADVDLDYADDGYDPLGGDNWGLDTEYATSDTAAWSPIDGYTTRDIEPLASPSYGQQSLLSGGSQEVVFASDFYNAADSDIGGAVESTHNLDVSEVRFDQFDNTMSVNTSEGDFYNAADSDIGGAVESTHNLDVSEVRFDQFDNTMSVNTSEGDFSLRYSEITGRLSGQLVDGGSLEVWTDDVTGVIQVSQNAEIQSFRHDAITDSWVSVGENGVHRIDSDPITGEMRVHTPQGTSRFRLDPFSNRIFQS
jgi:flavin-binding protein dodecin